MKSKHKILTMKWCFLAFCILTILSTASLSWAATATISGKVTDTNGFAQNVHVYLLSADGSYPYYKGDCSDASGYFEISGIEAGKYILAAGGEDCGMGTHHAQTFYKEDPPGNFVGTYDPKKADLFNLTGSETLTKNFYLELGASISGKVEGSGGVPLEKVNIGVSPVGIDNWGYGACTDSSGNYSVIGLPPGSYRVSAGGPNWCDGVNYGQVFYDNKPDWNSADVVTLNPGGTLSDINFSGLLLGATVTGTVTDAGGVLLANVPVNVQGSTQGFGGCTDNTGSYTIGAIPPGTYRVSAGGQNWCGGLNYAQVFYNNKPNLNSADLITLKSGDTLSNVNFSGLVEGATISGNVTVSEGTGSVNVNVHGTNWGYGACTDSSGSYSVTGIPPGTYRVSAGGPNWCGGLNYVQVFYDNKPDLNSADLITLKSGDTLSNVNFSGLVEGATISGSVTDSQGTVLANVNINVHGTNWGYGACTDSSGSYSVTGIPPGTYRVSAGGGTCGGGQFYKQVFYDNKPDWNSADLITLLVGEPRTGINFYNLTLDAAISGMITGDPNIGIRNINVVLHDNSGRLVNFQRIGAGGGYYFGGLTPGETYTIKVYDPFLRYQYAERGGLVVSSGGLITANFTLTNYVPTGTNPPIFKSNPMAFVIHRPDGSEILQVSAEVEDPSGCQPASLKSVTAIGPDGTLHYLYHEKYQALVDLGLSYGEFWWTSRDNEFADMNTQKGNFTITVLDVEGNRATATANLGSYSKYKLPIPTLNDPPDLDPITTDIEVDPNSLTLSWNSVTNALSYQVRITYLGERIWKSGRITGTWLTVPPGILLEGRWYDWTIMAFDSAAPGQFDYASVSESRSFFTIGGVTPPSEALSVQIVPWVPGSPVIPHDAYAGRQTTLKAVAKGGTPPYTYTWDFGDVSSPVTATTSNRYNLQAFHQYGSSSDTFYEAQITVTDSSAAPATASAIYPVRFWTNPSRGVKVNVAIDDALWWFHKNMSRFTSDGIDYGKLNSQYYPTGSTALALQAWVLNGHSPADGDPNNPYVEDTIRAKNYILDHLHPICIGPETVVENTRNPDSNGNGRGLYVKNGHRMYETGLAIMALATLKDQSLTETIQDLVDYLSMPRWSQMLEEAAADGDTMPIIENLTCQSLSFRSLVLRQQSTI